VALLLLNSHIAVATDVQIMKLTLKKIENGKACEVVVLSLNGYLGNDEFIQVDKALAQLCEQKQSQVVIDLTRLSFTTSVILARFLVAGREFCRQGGELKLVGLSSELSWLAKLAGFNEEKDFEPDVAAALKKMALLPKKELRQPPKKKK
jgi:anti-anti-sigma factor